MSWPTRERDVTVHTSGRAVQRLCMKKCGVRQVYLSTPPVDSQEIKFPASEMTSLNKKENKKNTVQPMMRFAKNPTFIRLPIVVLLPVC